MKRTVHNWSTFKYRAQTKQPGELKVFYKIDIITAMEMADNVLLIHIELLLSIYLVLYKDNRTVRVGLNETKCPR